jgi:Big-like domain-containing protein
MKVIGRGRRALVGVILAVTAGSASFGAVAITSGHASIVGAATTLPTSLTNDPGATLGGVDFFNASGVQITTGPLTAPFAAFAVAQNAPATAQSPQKAALYAYTPVLGEAPGSWSGAQIHHVTSAYPVTAPADLAGLPSANVVYTATTKDTSLSTYVSLFPNTDTSTTDGYAGIYTIRVIDINGDYAKADILISGSTWTQEDGTFTPPTSGSGPTATTTAVTANPDSPITAGTSVTFTATVTPTAAGAVQFMDGAATLGSPVTVTTGTATYTTTSLSAATHSITAVFTPTESTAFSPSTSTALSYVVNASGATATSTAIAANPGGPVTSGTSVMFTATVTPSTAPGSVQFMDGTSTLGSPVTVADGLATFTTSNLSVDTHSITAVFTSSTPSAFASSTSLPLSIEVDASTGSGPATTTTQLTANPTSPTTAGTSVTFTATVSPSSAAGSMQFMDGTNALGSPVTVSSGSATSAAITTLSTTTHSITAVFTPTDSAAFTSSTSDPLSYVVNAAGTSPTQTSTTVTASPVSPTTSGTSVTFTATVTPSAAAGTVQFMDGTSALGSPVTVSSGTATSAAVTTLSTATHSITAVFTPTNSALYTTSTSTALSYVINAVGTPVTTTTALTSTLASPTTTTGTSVTFTATLTPNAAVGTVQFMNGTTAMGSPVAVSSGTATYTTSFGAAASYSITAVFTPTSTAAYTTSTSTAINVVVTGATVTSTALAVSPASTAAVGANVQLTATLTPSTAIGSVGFYDGTTSLGTVAVASGSATLSTTTLAVGSTHSFVATFTPTDATAFKTSQSPAVAYTITAADTTTPTLTGPDGSTLSSDPTLTTGEVVTVQAGGFTAGESVSAVVHSTPETLTPTTASSTGTISYAFTVPSDLPAGAHSLVLTGATSQTTVTIDFSIATPAVLGTTTTSATTPSAGSASLPFTGSDIELLTAIAIACTGVGLAMRTRKGAPRYAAGHEWRRRH